MPSTVLWADNNTEYWNHFGEKTGSKIDKQIKAIGRLLLDLGQTVLSNSNRLSIQ